MTDLATAAAGLLLALAVLIQGFRVQQSIVRSRQALNAMLKEFAALGRSNLALDDDVAALRRRIEDLENGRAPARRRAN